MHEFLAGSWCFVVRCSASRRSFRRRSRSLRSTRVLKLSVTQSRPVKRNFSFIILLPNDSIRVRPKAFPVRIASPVPKLHESIAFTSASGCPVLWDRRDYASKAMTSSGDRTQSLTPASIAGVARVTLKALSSREIARLLEDANHGIR
jgi:hypothetical protein